MSQKHFAKLAEKGITTRTYFTNYKRELHFYPNLSIFLTIHYNFALLTLLSAFCFWCFFCSFFSFEPSHDSLKVLRSSAKSNSSGHLDIIALDCVPFLETIILSYSLTLYINVLHLMAYLT